MTEPETLSGPDFFIVGAPKCGTTAMTDYLGQHPEIGMCPRKETHVFATDLYDRLAAKRGQRPPDHEEFLRLFADLQNQRTRGEASVWHLYSAVAANEIKSFEPEAKIVVMLRNPFDMLPSLHSQLVYVGLEPIDDFATALALDDERERSGTPVGFPPRSYRSAVRYAEQIQRYLEAFGPDRIHVIRYDEFRDDTLGTFRGTCEFLGVDSTFEPTIEVINPNKRVRSRLMRRLVRRPPEGLRSILHRVTSKDLRRRAGAEMNRLNTRFDRRPPVPDEVRNRLRPEVERQVVELDDRIGLDVSVWLAERL
jgi:hypothetical protein